MDEIRILIATKEVALEFMHRRRWASPCSISLSSKGRRLGDGVAGATADSLRPAAPQLKRSRTSCGSFSAVGWARSA